MSHETLDRWLGSGEVEVEDDLITMLGAGQQFKVVTAVAFVREVATGVDEHKLLGKVKDVEQIGELDGEHYADSVIVGDCAYEVIEGYAGVPVSRVEPDQVDGEGESDIELLSRFFMTT